MREKFRESGTEAVIEVAEATIIGGGIGYLRGRYGDGALNVGKSQLKDSAGTVQLDPKDGKTPLLDPQSGVPIPIIAGLALVAGSFTSMVAKSPLAEDHVRQVGNLAIGIGMSMLGERVGAKQKAKADATAAPPGGTGTHTMEGDRYNTREIGAGTPDFAHLTQEEREAWARATGR
jgi:hypothetical protein